MEIARVGCMSLHSTHTFEAIDADRVIFLHRTGLEQKHATHICALSHMFGLAMIQARDTWHHDHRA